jgi:transaldolase
MEAAPMGNSEFDVLAANLLELLDTIAELQRTLEALADHGVIIGDSITGTATDAQRVLEEVKAVGVDLEDAFGVLEDDGVAKCAASWQQLLDAYPASAGTAENTQGSGEPVR